MIRATVTVDDRFPQLHAQVEQLARRATEAATEAAAAAAEAASTTIDLELRKIPPTEDPDGVAAGIRSEKTGARGVRIAKFFDKGTLGNRRGKLKRPGRSSWSVDRKGSSYTAHRGNVDGKGIKAERFFAKARKAGLEAMANVVRRGI